MGTDYLGEFEHLVLLAVLRLADQAYGVPIRRTIEEQAQRAVSFGAVYSTLRRLEAKGFVAAVTAPPDASSGRPKRIFQLTEPGLETLSAARRRLQKMADGLDQVAVIDHG